MLKYCLDALDANRAVEDCLDGLPLMLLNDGQVTHFRRRGTAQPYYLVPEENENLLALLEPVPSALVRYHLPEALRSQLVAVALQVFMYL